MYTRVWQTWLPGAIFSPVWALFGQIPRQGRDRRTWQYSTFAFSQSQVSRGTSSVLSSQCLPLLASNKSWWCISWSASCLMRTGFAGHSCSSHLSTGCLQDRTARWCCQWSFNPGGSRCRFRWQLPDMVMISLSSTWWNREQSIRWECRQSRRHSYNW